MLQRPLLLFTLSLICTGSTFSQDIPLESTVAADAVDLAPLMVIGSQANVPTFAGSAAFVSAEQIDRQTYANPNRVLQQVPGVYVREEDGFGNFPNISLRGADGGRSSKATIMEDGIIMAPALYSAPSAY